MTVLLVRMPTVILIVQAMLTNKSRVNYAISKFRELNVLITFNSANKFNVKFAHTNINSVSHKFDPLAEALAGNLVDVLVIQESKLDESFPSSQFSVSGFRYIW